MAPPPTCPACRVPLEPGFLPEATVGGFFVSVWHPGDATTEKHGFLERLASPGGIRYVRDSVLAIDAWRCSSCGRLELFANQRPEAREAL